MYISVTADDLNGGQFTYTSPTFAIKFIDCTADSFDTTPQTLDLTAYAGLNQAVSSTPAFYLTKEIANPGLTCGSRTYSIRETNGSPEARDYLSFGPFGGGDIVL